MFDPLSMAAVTSVLGAVGGGMASEVGRAASESLGGFVRRIAGREVAAPSGAGEREAVGRIVHEAVQRDGLLARDWTLLIRGVPTPGTHAAVPQSLPAAARCFTDRQDPMKVMDREFGRPADGTPKVVSVFGPEGIGTSGLAVHWGWRKPERFPDGRLYADLRGGSADRALDPAAVLGTFLAKLGLARGEIPPGLDDRMERFRAEVAGRRVLVVLDHAHSAAQVRPLLAPAPGVFTVVVSRRPLAGLDAVPVPVGPLADRDAVRLLTDLAGKPAVAAAKRTLPSLLERCGGSPYALRAAVPRLGAPVRDDPHAGDPLRDAAEDAYRSLDADAARCYRLLSLRPWPGLSAPLAAAALDRSVHEARRVLETLTEHRLLELADNGRLAYRAGVRRHAEAAAVREDGPLVCATAVARTVTWLLEFAVTADRQAHPGRWTLGPLYASLPPGPYAGSADALAAVDAELDNLVEAVRAAGELGDRERTWQLCEALWAVQLRAGRHDEVLPALRLGVPAADALDPDSRMAGRMHTQYALALIERQEYGPAEAELLLATRACERAGHLLGQATAAETLGLLRLRQWRFTEAFDLFTRAGTALDGIRPGTEDAEDVPRAKALLERHSGRAARGATRFTEARERGAAALRFFRDSGDVYNAGRTLTDLAQVELDVRDYPAALPLLDEAISVLTTQQATFHVARLVALREGCVNAAE